MYEGEPAVRIWAWLIDPDLRPEEREEAGMRLYVACAEEALTRGRVKSFVYAWAGSPHASFLSRLPGSTVGAGPGMVVVVSDLQKTLQRGRAMLAAQPQTPESSPPPDVQSPPALPETGC